jgi:hypothetical protein
MDLDLATDKNGIVLDYEQIVQYEGDVVQYKGKRGFIIEFLEDNIVTVKFFNDTSGLFDCKANELIVTN